MVWSTLALDTYQLRFVSWVFHVIFSFVYFIFALRKPFSIWYVFIQSSDCKSYINKEIYKKNPKKSLQQVVRSVQATCQCPTLLTTAGCQRSVETTCQCPTLLTTAGCQRSVEATCQYPTLLTTAGCQRSVEAACQCPTLLTTAGCQRNVEATCQCPTLLTTAGCRISN